MKYFRNKSMFYKFYRIVYYILLKRHIYGLTSPIRLLPDFIVIGVVRGGTTSLYHYLAQHSCIRKSAYDEIGFFDDNFHLGLNWYRSMFPTKFTKQSIEKKYGKFMTYEVTPFYIYNPTVANRILSLLPTIKLIALLRNPVDRAYSNYQLAIRSGKEKRSFEEVIEFDMKFIEKNKGGLKDDNYFHSIVARSPLARGFYAEQLQIWVNLFPKMQLLVISTEDLDSRPNETLATIFEFLNLPNYQIKDLTKRNEAKYPSMKPETRKCLLEYFRPYNEQLYHLIGKKFQWD